MTRHLRRRTLRLMDRDEDIIEFVRRYRLATRDVLQRKFFEDSELNAVTKVTSRLVDTGYLARHPFVGTSSYYSLGLLGAKFFGIHKRCTEPLGVQSLVNQYGLLEYCNAPGANRNRFLVSELAKEHPHLLQKGLDSSNYVVDATREPPSMQFVRVDGGGTLDHLVRKIRGDISSRQENTLCDLLMKNGQFEIVCVTYTKEKYEKLLAMFEKESLPCRVHPFRCDNLRPLLDLQNAVTHRTE